MRFDELNEKLGTVVSAIAIGFGKVVPLNVKPSSVALGLKNIELL
jgi:hypothetical protein